jgi:hypothetical protein
VGRDTRVPASSREAALPAGCPAVTAADQAETAPEADAAMGSNAGSGSVA